MNPDIAECDSIELVPSSARSVSSAASPLPSQLEPLLSSPVMEIAKGVVGRVMPISKRSVLEEAEWEDDADEEGAFDREMTLQCRFSLFDFFFFV